MLEANPADWESVHGLFRARDQGGGDHLLGCQKPIKTKWMPERTEQDSNR